MSRQLKGRIFTPLLRRKPGGTFSVNLTNFAGRFSIDTFLFYSYSWHSASSWNQNGVLPLTTRMAEVDRLSTSVSITQTYFPPWFNWMFRIIRSPDIVWKEIRPTVSEPATSGLFLRSAFGFSEHFSYVAQWQILQATDLCLFKSQQQTWQMYFA